MAYLVSGALIVAGIIHVLPLTGVLGTVQLSSLYGLQIDDNNLLILMRHRAVLFALLGAFLLVSVFKPQWQPMAIIAGLISTCSFLWLALSTGGYNDELDRVIWADIVAIVCLLGAAGLRSFLPTA